MDILQAARKLRPGTSWSCDVENGEPTNLRQAEDGSERVAVPSLEELQPIMDSDIYAIDRKAAYPSIGDQLDAFWKGGAAAESMRVQIQAVKDKYPKQ